MYKLYMTELAQNDLDSIVDYIALQLGNPTAAGSFLDEVDRCYSYLKLDPFIYAKCIDTRLESEGYRKAVVKNYLIIFKVNEVKKAVMIYRIIYGGRDYIKLI